MRNCSGERIACHSLSGLILDEDDMARMNDGMSDERESERGALRRVAGI